jgi:hypothetical protein
MKGEREITCLAFLEFQTALGFLKARSRSARSFNCLLVRYFGFVLFVFRRIYSHVKQVLFFLDEKCYTFFFLENPRSKGVLLVRAHVKTSDTSSTTEPHSTSILGSA